MIQIDMQMPTNCYDCWIRQNMGCRIADGSGWLNDRRDDDCPLKAQEPQYPVCEHCGKQIDRINTSVFNYDGSDSEHQMLLTFDKETGCVVFETTQNWTGYELTDEERKEGIRCPHCGEYPFDKSVEIEFHELVDVLMWTSRPTDAQREATPWA